MASSINKQILEELQALRQELRWHREAAGDDLEMDGKPEEPVKWDRNAKIFIFVGACILVAALAIGLAYLKYR